LRGEGGNGRGDPAVSVIVPVFRGMEHLPGCLDSLAGQSAPAESFEVLVVDNGGNPDIEALLARYPSFGLLQEGIPGSYAARNAGVRAARGAVLAFTDADCRPAPDWLAAGLSRLRRNPDVDLVGGAVRVAGSAGAQPTLAERYEALTAFPQERYVREMDFAVTANLFVRRSVMEALHGFDAGLQSGGDRDFGQRAKAAGHRLVYEASALVMHPARATMQQLVNKARRVAAGEMDLWAKGGHRMSARDWLNMLLPPVLWAWRLLWDRDLSWTLSQRLLVIWVRHLLHLAVLPVRLRLLVGGRSGMRTHKA
jgi:glycosyltransferase involved in cell wall biosynthesis